MQSVEWQRDEVSEASRQYSRMVADGEEQRLVERARRGDSKAMDALLRRYMSFVKIKASSYFLAGGDSDDLVQEGMIGLYKAVRDFRREKEVSFRCFAELCITRQIITAIKTATRNKHTPLNGYVSFAQTPAGQDENEFDGAFGDTIAGSRVDDPVTQVISTQELRSLVECLEAKLSDLEAQVLSGYLDGRSYDEIGLLLNCEAKTVDNALQRIKKKVTDHRSMRDRPLNPRLRIQP